MKNRFILSLVSVLLTTFVSHAQCFLDRHSTDWNDGWVSCTMTPNPNTVRGTSHWIQYDLGQNYILEEMHLWNSNEFGKTDRGIQEYYVDYSLDGLTWTELGLFNLDQASGSGFFEGNIGPDFDDTEARYVLITPISNHGGTCYGLAEIRINVQSSVVPVELIYFNAKCNLNGSSIILEWETATELNNDQFIIEKSNDNRNWEELTKVPSKGDSESNTEYSFVDSDLFDGKNYYRLIQVDTDGTSRVLKSVVSDCELDVIGLDVFPNPFNSATNISFSTKSNELIKMKVHDPIGRLVFEQTISPESNQVQIEFNAQELSAGQYYLSLKQGMKVQRKKMIVQ